MLGENLSWPQISSNKFKKLVNFWVDAKFPQTNFRIREFSSWSQISPNKFKKFAKSSLFLELKFLLSKHALCCRPEDRCTTHMADHCGIKPNQKKFWTFLTLNVEFWILSWLVFLSVRSRNIHENNQDHFFKPIIQKTFHFFTFYFFSPHFCIVS